MNLTDSKQNLWKTMNNEFKTSIKQNILKAIINEKDKSVRFSYCEAIAKVVENIFDLEDDDNNEEFNDLNIYLFNVLNKCSIDESNLLEVETALVILSKVFGFIYEKIGDKLNVLVNSFKVYFKSESMSIRTKTTQVLTEIYSIVKKKDAKKFKDFMFNILETCLKCMENPKEEANVSF